MRHLAVMVLLVVGCGGGSGLAGRDAGAAADVTPDVGIAEDAAPDAGQIDAGQADADPYAWSKDIIVRWAFCTKVPSSTGSCADPYKVACYDYGAPFGGCRLTETLGCVTWCD